MLRSPASTWHKLLGTSLVVAGLILFAPALTAAADVPDSTDGASLHQDSTDGTSSHQESTDGASSHQGGGDDQPGEIVTETPEPEPAETEIHEPPVDATTEPEPTETGAPTVTDQPAPVSDDRDGEQSPDEPTATSDTTTEPEEATSEPAPDESTTQPAPTDRPDAAETAPAADGRGGHSADSGGGAVVPAEPGNGGAVQPRVTSTEAVVEGYESVPVGAFEDALKTSADKAGQQEDAAKKQKIVGTGVDGKFGVFGWFAVALGVAGLLLRLRLRRNA